MALKLTRVTLPCGHCGGTGQKEAPELTRTLESVSFSQWRSTQFIARELVIGETNAANKLRELMGLGFVERRGGKPYEWRRK
jgi:hypothetical protein